MTVVLKRTLETVQIKANRSPTRILVRGGGSGGGASSASAVSFTPAGNIAATNVQAAIEELDAEKQPLDADLTAIAALSTTAGGRGLLTLSDPNADRIVFWDDSAGVFTHLSLGTGLAISGTSLDLDSDLQSWANVTRASGFDTFAATPSSSNLRALLTDETGGGGGAVFANSPTISAPTFSASATIDLTADSLVPTLTMRKAKAGTAAVTTGEGLGGNLWSPYDGTNYGTPNCAAFFAYAGENFNTGAHGCYFEYELAPIGGTTRATRLRITPTTFHLPSIGTTASAANAFLDSGSSPANSLLRSTSSLAYKKDVEPVDDEIADRVLREGEPIWYRSLAVADKLDDGREKSFYSFGAEPLAEIDPRLVTWGYKPEDWLEVEEDCSYQIPGKVPGLVPKEGAQPRKDGTFAARDLVEGEVDGMVTVPDKRLIRTPREGAEKVPDGINDRAVIAMLFNIVKRQEARIAALESGSRSRP